MSFWASTTAAPSFWTTLSSNLLRGYIRTTSVPYPHTPEDCDVPRRLLRSDAPNLSAFWRNHYGGDDWYLDCNAAFVGRYLVNPDIYVYGLFKKGRNELVGTIVSTPFTEGHTYMSHGAILGTVRVIEGLCIHRDYRSKGIAGFLIGYMDAVTSQPEPVAHLWGRELAASSFFSTALRTDTYAYIRCIQSSISISMIHYDSTTFRNLWTTSSRLWVHGTVPRIVTTVPNIQSGDVWIASRSLTDGKYPIVVILNTHRKTRNEQMPIYEVVWCGYRKDGILYPTDGSIQYREFIEQISTRYNGLLFTTSAPYNGGATSTWKEPWIYGTSGVHSWFIYNYIPPSFGNCELLTIRDEL